MAGDVKWEGMTSERGGQGASGVREAIASLQSHLRMGSLPGTAEGRQHGPYIRVLGDALNVGMEPSGLSQLLHPYVQIFKGDQSMRRKRKGWPYPKLVVNS